MDLFGPVAPPPGLISALRDNGDPTMVPTDLVRKGVTFLLVYNYLATFLFCLIAVVLMKNGLKVFAAKRFVPIFCVLGLAIVMSLISSIINSVYWASQLLHRGDKPSVSGFWLASITLIFLVPLVTQCALTIRMYALLPPMLVSTRKRAALLALPVTLKVVRLVVLSIAMARTRQSINSAPIFPTNALYASSSWGFLMAELWLAFFDSLYASTFLMVMFLRSGRRNDSSLLTLSSGWLSGWLKLGLYACMFSFVVPTLFALVLAISITIHLNELTFGYLLIVNVILQNVGGVLGTLSSQHKWRNSRFSTSGIAHATFSPSVRTTRGSMGGTSGGTGWSSGAVSEEQIQWWQGRVPPAVPDRSMDRRSIARANKRRPSFLRGPNSLEASFSSMAGSGKFDVRNIFNRFVGADGKSPDEENSCDPIDSGGWARQDAHQPDMAEMGAGGRRAMSGPVDLGHSKLQRIGSEPAARWPMSIFQSMESQASGPPSNPLPPGSRPRLGSTVWMHAPLDEERDELSHIHVSSPISPATQRVDPKRRISFCPLDPVPSPSSSSTPGRGGAFNSLYRAPSEPTATSTEGRPIFSLTSLTGSRPPRLMDPQRGRDDAACVPNVSPRGTFMQSELREPGGVDGVTEAELLARRRRSSMPTPVRANLRYPSLGTIRDIPQSPLQTKEAAFSPNGDNTRGSGMVCESPTELEPVPRRRSRTVGSQDAENAGSLPKEAEEDEGMEKTVDADEEPVATPNSERRRSSDATLIS
ncbi:hypothetical protein OC846_000254 [Tilletia horrida]|uniref:Uncharacterized protein n=1 Tax=Tilletia horrida TaxID=155126 RepID=A0AAN6GX88_9BASI|nr:hypothetical protein OC846_000254 [Tilletia horrida]